MSDYITTMPRDDQDRKGLLRTFTGRYVNPLALHAEDVEIRDIAHHLSIESRFGGACPTPYSVAQHSVLCSAYSCEPRMQMALLLHDAAEYVLKDIPSPIKRDPRMKWYADIEHATTKMIFEKYGLDPGLLAQTKDVDDAVFRHEVASWWGDTHDRIVCWDAAEAEDIFLYTFWKLERQI